MTVETHSHEEEDLLLLEQMADGDEKAFETLFRRYVPRLFPIVKQIVITEAVVMDVIQEVFLKIWLNREKFESVQMPRNYIFRMAYTQSFKHLRKQLRANRVHSVVGEMQSAAIADTPELTHDLKETQRLIEQAVGLLAGQSRRIYLLSRHSGYKPQAIAEQLGINVQSVRNSLSRSAQTIRDHLAEHGVVIPLVLLVWSLR